MPFFYRRKHLSTNSTFSYLIYFCFYNPHISVFLLLCYQLKTSTPLSSAHYGIIYSQNNPFPLKFQVKSFLFLLATKKGVERNLLVKRFFKEIIYSKENVKITLFYSENLENSDTKESPALLSQGRANFSGRNETSSFPPHQKWGVPQHLEFVSESDGSKVKRVQTFSIILPNLIHQSKKRDLNH